MAQELLHKPLPGTQINRSHPLAKGLVGCWLMNEQGNRCFDLSGHNNHGTLNGFTSPTYSLGQRSTNGIKFDGVDDYVSLNTISSINSTQPYSISGYFITNDVTIQQTIFSKVDASNRVEIGIVSGTLRTAHFNGSSYQLSRKSGSIINNTRYNFVYTYDGAGVGTLYINSVLQTASGAALVPSSIVGVSIGVNPTPARYFNGSIDEVSIYNRALSASEVKQLYLNPYDIFMRS